MYSVPASRVQPADAGLGLCKEASFPDTGSAARCLQSCGACALTCGIEASASFVDSDVMEPTASHNLKGPAGAPLPPAEYVLCYKAYQAGHLCFLFPTLVECIQASRLDCVPRLLHLCKVWSNEGSSLGMDISKLPVCQVRCRQSNI